MDGQSKNSSSKLLREYANMINAERIADKASELESDLMQGLGSGPYEIEQYPIISEMLETMAAETPQVLVTSYPACNTGE